jgi:hypothetical protein
MLYSYSHKQKRKRDSPVHRLSPSSLAGQPLCICCLSPSPLLDRSKSRRKEEVREIEMDDLLWYRYFLAAALICCMQIWWFMWIRQFSHKHVIHGTRKNTVSRGTSDQVWFRVSGSAILALHLYNVHTLHLSFLSSLCCSCRSVVYGFLLLLDS